MGSAAVTSWSRGVGRWLVPGRGSEPWHRAATGQREACPGPWGPSHSALGDKSAHFIPGALLSSSGDESRWDWVGEASGTLTPRSPALSFAVWSLH